MPTYQYGGKTYELKEGLSNEEALSKIKASLGEEIPVMEAPKETAPSMLNRLGRQAGLAARAGITGLAAVPAAMADFATGAAGLMAGKAIKPPSQGLQEVLTGLGLPEPSGALERAVQAGTGAMAGTGAQALASKGVPLVADLSKNLLQQTAASGAGGFAGQLGSEAATNITGNPLAGIAAGLVTGTLAGAAAGSAAAKAGKTVAPVTIEQVKDRASQGYAKMQEQGVAIKPKSILDMLNNAEQELKTNNFNPLMEAHKPVAQVLDQLRNMTGTQRVPFTTLEQMRSAVTDLKTSNDPATRRFAGQLVQEIDGYISSLNGKDIIAGKTGLDTAVKSVEAARKDWRNMSKATILEDALNVAEARALDPKASEGDLIRRGLINLAANKKKINQFSEAEQNAIKSVAKGSKGDPLLSLIARFNPERSQLTAGASVAGTALNPLAATIPAAGFAADKYLGYARSKNLKDLISSVAGGNVQAPPPSMAWRGLLGGMQPPESGQ